MKTSKKGYVIKRGSYLYLQLNHKGTRKLKAIKDDTGQSVTTKEDAEKYRQDTADEIIKELTGTGNIPLDEIYNTYKEYLPIYRKKKGRKHIDAPESISIAPATQYLNKTALDRFLKFLKEKSKASQDTGDITPALAKSFFASLRKEGLKESTFNRYLMGLRNIFDVLPQTSKDNPNPFKTIDQATPADVKEDTTKKQRFEVEELKTISEKAKERKDWVYPAIVIGYATGFRLGDVLNLKWKHIDQEGFITKYETRKNRKEVEQYRPELLLMLAEWKESFKDGVQEDSYIFPVQAQQYKKDRSAPVKIFQKFLEKDCGIITREIANGNDGNPIKDKDGNPVYGQTIKGFHSFRVSNATYGKLSGQAIDEIKHRLGHSDEKTTKGYIQETLAERKKKLIEDHKPVKLLDAFGVETKGTVIDITPASELDELKKRLKSALELIESAEISVDTKVKLVAILNGTGKEESA